MKEVMLLLVAVLGTQALMAQTFSEWFRQNKTQLKYLEEQIAALQEYISTIDDGYSIAGAGLGSIDTVITVDLDIHSAHFNYFKEVSPGVSADARIAGIRKLLKLLPAIADDIAAAGLLQPAGAVDWPTFAPAIADSIRQGAVSDEIWLEAVLANGLLLLSDAERESKIDLIALDVQFKTRSALSLLAELQANRIKSGL